MFVLLELLLLHYLQVVSKFHKQNNKMNHLYKLLLHLMNHTLHTMYGEKTHFLLIYSLIFLNNIFTSSNSLVAHRTLAVKPSSIALSNSSNNHCLYSNKSLSSFLSYNTNLLYSHFNTRIISINTTKSTCNLYDIFIVIIFNYI